MKKIAITCLVAAFALMTYSCDETNEAETQSAQINSQDLNKEELATVNTNIQKVIDLFKAGDVKGLAAIAEYPVKRPNPLPALENAAAFEANFKLMFPEALLNVIKSSKVEDWDAVGSNGIVISDPSGEHSLWLQDGGATIKAINSTTNDEEALRIKALADAKSKVHASLRDFVQTDFIITTAKYTIRIDQMKDDSYRYAAWNTPKADMSNLPDLVINKGEAMHEGRLGDMNYSFKNDKTVYQVMTSMFGEKGSPDAYLTVLEGEKEILNQEGKIIFGN